MFEIDGERGLGERGGHVVVEPAGAGSAVVAGRPDEPDGAAPLRLRDPGKVLEQANHHREPGAVVERRLEVAVHVREDRDVLVGRTGEGTNDAGGFQA
jgi:hypothetical protein